MQYYNVFNQSAGRKYLQVFLVNRAFRGIDSDVVYIDLSERRMLAFADNHTGSQLRGG